MTVIHVNIILVSLKALLVINAKIIVTIKLSRNETEIEITFDGSNIDIVSEEDRKLIHLNESLLREAISTGYGTRPNDDEVYTKFDIIEHRYPFDIDGWDKSVRTIRADKAKIVSTTGPHYQTLWSNTYDRNESPNKKYIDVRFNNVINDKVYSNWMSNYHINVTDEIEYRIDRSLLPYAGKPELVHKVKWASELDRWRKNVIAKRTYDKKIVGFPCNNSISISIPVEPNQKLYAEVIAARGTMKIEIDFKATIGGDVTLWQYTATWGQRITWTNSIVDVLRYWNLNDTFISKQMLEFEYFFDPVALIRDYKTFNILYKLPLNMYQ